MRSKAPSASRSDAGRPRARSTSSSRRCPPWSRACTGSRRADVRLFLFDVDGTLLTARGAGRAAFKEALKRTFGTAEGLDAYDLRGKTDQRVVWDVLTAAGVPREEIEARVGACFEAYLGELETILGDGSAIQIMPGIRELVPALSARPDAVVGLLTGNIEAGARLKLRPTGLLEHFRVGAFGSDHIDRRCLPSIARERAGRLVGHDFDFERVTIIGDTPHDVDCARACGAVAVVVATGGWPAGRVDRDRGRCPDGVLQRGASRSPRARDGDRRRAPPGREVHVGARGRRARRPARLLPGAEIASRAGRGPGPGASPQDDRMARPPRAAARGRDRLPGRGGVARLNASRPLRPAVAREDVVLGGEGRGSSEARG